MKYMSFRDIVVILCNDVYCIQSLKYFKLYLSLSITSLHSQTDSTRIGRWFAFVKSLEFFLGVDPH